MLEVTRCEHGQITHEGIFGVGPPFMAGILPVGQVTKQKERSRAR